MSRRAKGPRLYFRQGRVDRRTGRPISDVWVIRDGTTEISTGCGADGDRGAQEALGAYIAAKWSPGPQGAQGDAAGARDPSDPAAVYLAEVMALYLREKAPKTADPGQVAARFKALLWWSDKTVADVRRSSCEAYVAHRTAQPIAVYKDAKTAPRVSEQSARRELEDLSAAIGHWDGEYTLSRRPKVALPLKPPSQRDALTRGQAARLLKASLGFRWDPKARDGAGAWIKLSVSARANRAHLRRFLLIGYYTGTRPGVIPRILWEESAATPWTDLAKGVIYRRGRDEREHKTKRRPLVRLTTRLLAHMRRWRAADRDEDAAVIAAALAAGEPAPQLPQTVLRHGLRPISGRIRTGFENLVADAGLNAEISPHWMRHTCATWLMEGGADLWDAAAYAGMTTATLEKCYGHHRPDHQAGAKKALGNRRGA